MFEFRVVRINYRAEIAIGAKLQNPDETIAGIFPAPRELLQSIGIAGSRGQTGSAVRTPAVSAKFLCGDWRLEMRITQGQSHCFIRELINVRTANPVSGVLRVGTRIAQ